MPTPLALTHWDDREVVIALPPLTCDPRIVKIRLPEVSAATGQITACADERAIVTLRDPVYFPTSTPRRGARLMYRGDGVAKTEDGHCLYLAMDTACSADGGVASGAGAGADDASATVSGSRQAESPRTPGPASHQEQGSLPGRVSPPVVLRWKIGPGDDGWRAWDPDEDGKASDLKRPIPIEKLLQGQFVDPDKLFSVSIRSGLDWTRKGYLSCATF